MKEDFSESRLWLETATPVTNNKRAMTSEGDLCYNRRRSDSSNLRAEARERPPVAPTSGNEGAKGANNN